MRLPRPAEPDYGDPMTPMIDVVFLLLVFFICASAGAMSEKLLPAELTGASATAATAAPEESVQDPAEHLQVRIRLQPGAAGLEVHLDEQVLAGLPVLRERLTRLAEADPESRIILSVHDAVEVQQFISVYDLCQSLKFRSISFAVSPEGRP